MKRTWFLVAAALVVLLVGWLVSGGCRTRVPVEAAAARVEPIREFIDEQAKTRLPTTQLVTMPVAGRIEAITLAESSPVKRGQVVARLVPRDVELSVEQARAAVQRLQASIKENADVSVEETGFQQALEFVASSKSMVEAALARVNSGKALFDYNESNLGRIAELVERKAASRDDLERATLQKLQSGFDLQQDRLIHAAAQAMQSATDLLPKMIRHYINRKSLSGAVLEEQKAEAQARLGQVLKDSERATMRSEVDGVVLRRFEQNERYLSAGTPLLEIGKLDDLELEVEVLSLEVVAAKVGDTVEIYGPAIGEPRARGRVMRIYPAGFTKVSSLGVEQQRVLVIVAFEPDDLVRLLKDRRLGVGFHVRARIFTAQESEATVVPRIALVRGNRGTWQVFVIRGGRAVLQDVEVGLMNDERAEILKGVQSGEQVIVAPESSLTDGVWVQVRQR